MTFGEKLKSLRESKGYPRKAVAPALRVSVVTYGNYETDIVTPSLYRCGLICKFYGIQANELFEGVELH